jgi:superfamily II DNA or RNA helicase
VFRQFKAGEVKIISNVGVLTTGFDSDVRCIILARPTRSEILYTQMIGRGLRKAEGKDHCLILDHSDTTLKLGFVTELGRATLDDGTARRQTTERKKPLPKECPKCTFLRPPKLSQCPACGFKPEARSQIACDDGELYELTKDKKLSVSQPKYTMAEKQIFYSELLHIASSKNYNSNWASHKYREKFGVWPKDLKHVARIPSLTTMNWVKHKNIAWVKGKQKARKVA